MFLALRKKYAKLSLLREAETYVQLCIYGTAETIFPALAVV